MYLLFCIKIVEFRAQAYFTDIQSALLFLFRSVEGFQMTKKQIRRWLTRPKSSNRLGLECQRCLTLVYRVEKGIKLHLNKCGKGDDVTFFCRYVLVILLRGEIVL
jgi:hypothetical protein